MSVREPRAPQSRSQAKPKYYADPTTGRALTQEQYTARTHSRWGLRCCDHDELATWLGAYKDAPTKNKAGHNVPPKIKDFCEDAWRSWCLQMVQDNRCVVAQHNGVIPDAPEPDETEEE
jgi:hypothetical protein